MAIIRKFSYLNFGFQKRQIRVTYPRETIVQRIQIKRFKIAGHASGIIFSNHKKWEDNFTESK